MLGGDVLQKYRFSSAKDALKCAPNLSLGLCLAHLDPSCLQQRESSHLLFPYLECCRSVSAGFLNRIGKFGPSGWAVHRRLPIKHPKRS
jgi:hypothetical protein